ncbi:hypothetical protein [Paraliomyxa miuraensis]|uniref:hypothetical protein n=1 Tax=Paraliomyxa miuraensis TaxID=376150 RepID=UPI0022532486|nr:hypothetical protein [Paraliomyxa miuraensis]MCX4244273.1 hypothetical protein [Paraliomyxa miuraensis]
MDTLNLTTIVGSSNPDLVPRVAEAVERWSGGLWLVPHTASDTEHEHYHGLVVGVDPRAVIERWVELAAGTAKFDAQKTSPVYELLGWLGYCRRQPGFNLQSVVASGGLHGPWSWALGQVAQPLSKPAWASTTTASASPTAAELADWNATRRLIG